MPRRNIVSMFLVVAACAFSSCSKTTESRKAEQVRADPAKIREIGIDELDKALASDTCTVLDANRNEVRMRNGKVPGAVLLSHYKDYKSTELPKNKARTLVFYCANTYCRASDVAAEKAVLAGYTDVNVLRAGIMGWAKAGKRTEILQ